MMTAEMLFVKEVDVRSCLSRLNVPNEISHKLGFFLEFCRLPGDAVTVFYRLFGVEGCWWLPQYAILRL